MPLVARIWRRLSTLWALRRARTVSRTRLARRAPRRLLILCYGNIYRSPFVEASLRARLESVAPAIELRSAGFHARSGRETPSDFVAVSRTYGVDLSNHRSTSVDASLIDWAELLVVMDRHNWEALGRFGPRAQAKAVWLGAVLDRGSVEIPDPYGRTAQEAGVIAQQLFRASCQLAAHWVAPSGASPGSG